MFAPSYRDSRVAGGGQDECGSIRGLFFDSRCCPQDRPGPVERDKKEQDGDRGKHEKPFQLLPGAMTSPGLARAKRDRQLPEIFWTAIGVLAGRGFPRFRYHCSKDSMHVGRARAAWGTDSGNSFSSASAKALSFVCLSQRPQMGIVSLIMLGGPESFDRDVRKSCGMRSRRCATAGQHLGGTVDGVADGI